jgi:2,4'-dihydroxyacetophenone dioxygenase
VSPWPGALLALAQATGVEAQPTWPWIPSATPGKSARPLRFLPDDRGFVELLRMEPGLAMPLHRHTGETHVYQLAGSRRLDSGEVVGPGTYVYEPAGNTDAWDVVGDEPLLALAIVIGCVEFVDADGRVRSVVSAATLRADAEAFMATQNPFPSSHRGLRQ